MRTLLFIAAALAANCVLATTVEMLPGEKWWGICNNFGREMPFTEKSEFKCDLRRSNYSHQSLSFLCSDRGRAVWCKEPVGVAISGGKIELVSDRGEIVVKEDAGRNLAEAYLYGSKNWFPPTGEEPELLYFSAPQYNTWIELTYHQNEKDILAYAQSMIDHGLPPGVFMIDDTWQLGYGEWYFDMRRFSDPKGMIDKLHAMGYKVLLWMCPFVSMDTPAFRRIAWGKNPDDVKGYPTKGGFLASSRKPGKGGTPPPASVNWWNGTSALLDFTHPNAVAWFDEQLDRLVKDYGADGFKFDGGGIHFYAGCVGQEGSSPKTFAHDPSASPAAQSALYGQFALKYKGSEYRNAFGFAGKPVVMRLHDKAHSWEALQRLIPDMLAAGFVGCPFICPDMVGGGEWSTFLPGSPFSEELFVRSAQVQALCPMMQFSASPWRCLNAGNQKIVKDVVDLRQRFAPKFVELAKASAKTGEPMMRNLEYCFPGLGYADVKDEFMMGDDLLVAPVVEAGATSRKVVLPPGKWKADDGKVYEGPATIEVAAPLSRLPHFEKCAEPPKAGGATAVEIAGAPFEMPPIPLPQFADRDFSIADFGAREGVKATEAFAAAMAACEKAGGGRVVVPRGKWLSGAVHFRSNCDLHLDEGATLEFTDDPSDYLPAVHTTWEGVECFNYSPLLYAYGVTNVAITGKGTIAPRMDLWKTWFTRSPEHMLATEFLYHWGSTNATMSARDVTAIKGSNVRPHLIQFNRCGNVLLDGFKIRSSPFWMIHLYHSENCVVRNLDTYAHGHNNDGVDIEMTRNVLVENCHFDQGDDGIVLKAGRNQDAWRLNRPTENVVVRNCEFAFGHTLLGIGSELSGGIRNIWMHHCRMNTAYNLLYIKTNRRRGGFVKDVFLEDIESDNIRWAVFGIQTDVLYQWAKFPDYELRRTEIGGIHVRNVKANCADYALNIQGDAEAPVGSISLENIWLGACRKAFSHVANAPDIRKVNVRQGDLKPKEWEAPSDDFWSRRR